MGVSGSIVNITLDGVSYNVAADSNFAEMGGPFENEMIATSGENLFKKTKRPEIIEGVIIICDAIERGLLQELSKGTEDFPMSYETADGTVRSAPGQINFDTRETEENRAALTLLPRAGWVNLTS